MDVIAAIREAAAIVREDAILRAWQAEYGATIEARGEDWYNHPAFVATFALGLVLADRAMAWERLHWHTPGERTSAYREVARIADRYMVG